ncbi:MAG: alpha/beta hydrolase [Minwuia sp.]|nr:alpha/beta hydrolase [Minwuia sp.]
MALARFTVCPETTEDNPDDWAIFVPDRDGTLVRDAYDPASRTGELMRLDGPLFAGGGAFAQHLRSIIPPTGPITIMTHGFQYAPEAAPVAAGQKAANPHSQVFHFEEPDIVPGGALEASSHATPWPKRLGFADDDGQTGLAIAFAWSSHPAYRSGTWRDWLSSVSWRKRGATTYYARAYRRAPIAGIALAALIAALGEVAPGRPIRLFAHSLGSRVVMTALRILAQRRNPVLGSVDRVVLMSGASHCGHARLALHEIMHAGMGQPRIYNLMTSQDAVLEFWGRRFAALVARDELAAHKGWSRVSRLLTGGSVIGRHGKPAFVRYRHWQDIQVDDPAVMDAFDLSLWGQKVDHWTLFTNPSFAGFAALLLAREKPLRRFDLIFRHGVSARKGAVRSSILAENA